MGNFLLFHIIICRPYRAAENLQTRFERTTTISTGFDTISFAPHYLGLMDETLKHIGPVCIVKINDSTYEYNIVQSVVDSLTIDI